MSNKTVMKRMQDYIRNKDLKRKQNASKTKVKRKVAAISKATPKVVVKRRHVGATKVSHSEYDPQKNQWIRHYN
jgi:hypothetical protein